MLANSVPSEQTFSSMNYIINKFRASIDIKQSNAAVYIYMNSKALHWAKKVATRWFTLSDAKENALKDNIVTMLKAKVE